MFKKKFFMGGAALFFILFLVLTGCNQVVQPILPKSPYTVDAVVLGINTLTVTFNDTLKEIDAYFEKPNYTTDRANYRVLKNDGVFSGGPDHIAKKTTGTDTDTVIITLEGVHALLREKDILTVAVRDMRPGAYMVSPPKTSIGKTNNANELILTFDRPLYSNSAPVTAGANLISLFKTQNNSGGALDIMLSKAAVYADDAGALYALQFKFSYAEDKDTLGPNNPTISSAAGLPWKALLRYDGAAGVWILITP